MTVVRNKGCGGIVQTHFIFSEFNGRQGECFFLSYLDEKLVWWIFFYNSLPFVVINSVDHLWHVRLFLLNLPPLFLQHHRMNFIVFIVLFERKLIVFCVSVCLFGLTHPSKYGRYVHLGGNFATYGWKFFAKLRH